MTDSPIERRLEALQRDFASVAGEPFSHFYCPITHLDEAAELCRGHIIPQLFPDSARDWVVQRKDVESFYGSRFEADFAAILYTEGGTPESVLLDKDLSRLFDITITADGKPIEYFFAKDEVSQRFTGLDLRGRDDQQVFLGLKLDPTNTFDKASAKWETRVSKDIRLPALVSLLKAGYLTLYSLLGYRYALSSDGHFLGSAMLGWFFQQNKGKKKPAVVSSACRFFAPAAHMVRPALKTPGDIAGTITDKTMLICRGSKGEPWGVIVFVKTSQQKHAVLLPLTESEKARELFMSFLVNDTTEFSARFIRFEGDHWLENPKVLTIEWPKGEGLLE